MSTKIYNGYNFGHQDVFALRCDINDRFRPVLLNAIHSRPVAHAVEMYDKLRSGSEKLVQEVYRDAQTFRIDAEPLTWLDLYRIAVGKDREDTLWNPLHQNNLEVAFMRDEKTGDILSRAFGGSCILELFGDAYSEFEYSYWNSSDRPEKLSAEEWAARRDTWDRVLGYNSPKSSGLLMTVLNDYETEPRLDYYEDGKPFVLPSMEDRVRVLARDLVGAEFVGSGQDAATDLYEFIEYVSRERIAEKSEAIRGTLDDTLDVESMRAALERPWTKDRKKTS